VYIDPAATCTFAEAVEPQGPCPSYTDTATLLGPGGVAYTTIVTIQNGVLNTVQYPVPTPAGLMPEGLYTLVNQAFYSDLTNLVGLLDSARCSLLCRHHLDARTYHYLDRFHFHYYHFKHYFHHNHNYNHQLYYFYHHP